MTEPTTAAGRKLALWNHNHGGGYIDVDDILAIEAEARQQDGSALDVDTLKWAIHYARKSNDAPEFDVAVAQEMAERIIDQLRRMPTMDALPEQDR